MKKVDRLQVENEEEEVMEGTAERKGPQPPAVELLWVFSCELTRGTSVTTMAWNKKNPVTPTRSHLKPPQTLSVLQPSLTSQIFPAK